MTDNKNPIKLVTVPMKFNDLQDMMLTLCLTIKKEDLSINKAKSLLKITLDHAYFEDFKIKTMLKEGLKAENRDDFSKAICSATDYIFEEYKYKEKELNWTLIKRGITKDASFLKHRLLEFLLLIMVGEKLQKVQEYLKHLLDSSYIDDSRAEKKLLSALEAENKSEFVSQMERIIKYLTTEHGA